LLASLRASATEQQARSGFAAIDKDDDGSITFDEFAAWYVAG
jgi:Ca2+-binding EF-hand superfamily protein